MATKDISIEVSKEMGSSNNETNWRLDTSYKQLPEAFYSKQSFNEVPNPEVVIFNDPLAERLSMPLNFLKANEGQELLAGNQLPDGREGLAQAYAGHQFGHFTMLGDGRALLLGEHITPEGERVDVQLKGSGRTVFSRGGDGRAALGPMLREYIMSEGMHGLGIPTTRSLAVMKTGQYVRREERLPGAVLTRIAKSHIRVGTFQFAAARGEVDDLKALADYAIERHEPDLQGDQQPYLSFLYRVIEKQAHLIAQWQLVGFVHGVMNTDNMAISGETIDYGPCAFLDAYDPSAVFSSIDTQGRYAYGNQPYSANWNVARFAEALLPLLSENQEQAVAIAQQAIEAFTPLYKQYWLEGMRTKLGLLQEGEEDGAFVNQLLAIMSEYKLDYTNTFRQLSTGEKLASTVEDDGHYQEWKKEWQRRLDEQPFKREEAVQTMLATNPYVIPRNEHMERVLNDAVEKNDATLLKKFLSALSNPFIETDEGKEFTAVSTNVKPYITYCGT